MRTILFLLMIVMSLQAVDPSTRLDLRRKYQQVITQPSDTRDHIPTLRDLSMKCSSVVEIGLRSIVSTWGILQGLADSPASNKTYLGIDLAYPPEENLEEARRIAVGSGIDFQFLQANDMTIDLEPADLLFIDSLHTYCHLTYELEKFSPVIKKYIAMHDTSDPWGTLDDTEYKGNYSEYPAEYDRNKRGLWPAVEDFLARHPEWVLQERKFNCYGFTVLRRVK